MHQSNLHQAIISGLISGIAACFMFMSFILMIFTLFPLMLAGLSWGTVTALFAGVVFFVLVSLLTDLSLGLAAGLIFAAPAVWLAHLTTESKPDENGKQVFYFADRILYWIMGIAAFFTLIFFALQADTQGGLPAVLSQMVLADTEFRSFLVTLTNTPMTEERVTLLSLYFIIIMPFIWVLMMISNLLLAQTVSARLKWNIRPSPAYGQFSLPVNMEILLGLGFFISFMSSGWPSALVASLTGIVLCGFFLLGLVTLYVISGAYSHPFRLGLLVLTYVLLFLFSWAYVLVSIIGILESRFALRAKFAPSKQQ